MADVIHLVLGQNMAYEIAEGGKAYIFDPQSWIYATSGPALHLTDAADVSSLVIEGWLSSTDLLYSALDVDAEGTEIAIERSASLAGQIGIDLTGVSADIVNRGSVSGTGIGIYLNDSAGRLVNHGVISGGNSGTAIVQAASTGTFTLENHGTIRAFNALSLDAPEIIVKLGKTSEIYGANGISVSAEAGDTASIVNHGLISSAVGYAYTASAGVDNFTNRGTVYGDIYLGNGDDTFTNRGKLDGDVYLGNEDDRFIDKGKFAGTISGAGGDDLFVLRSSGIVIFEGADAGNDTVRIGVTFTLADNVENLVLTGRRNADLTGNDGINTLHGNAGGNDLSGGLGEDTLTGGGGRDLFLYAMLDGGDTITDFKQGQDRIRIEGFTQFVSFADLDIVKAGKDVRISFAAESAADFILVEDQKVGAFDKGDFLFG